MSCSAGIGISSSFWERNRNRFQSTGIKHKSLGALSGPVALSILGALTSPGALGDP